jgi:hypothetical protein
MKRCLIAKASFLASSLYERSFIRDIDVLVSPVLLDPKKVEVSTTILYTRKETEWKQMLRHAVELFRTLPRAADCRVSQSMP